MSDEGREGKCAHDRKRLYARQRGKHAREKGRLYKRETESKKERRRLKEG